MKRDEIATNDGMESESGLSSAGSPEEVSFDKLSVQPRDSDPEWGSDLIAEMLRVLGVEYVALNPGASFRGLHDSLVNHTENERPGIILCNHEEVAVSIAHGYARFSGRSMASVVHSNVGLMHASMAIFNAWADRAPVMVFGATGPMDAARRRPWIDWIHTSHGQGEIVRDYTKWEGQPSSIEAIPEAILRAWNAAHGDPCGPVYLCFDADLQEQRLESKVMPASKDVARYLTPARLGPSPADIERAADWLVGASYPVILLGSTAQSDEAWGELVALAEALGAAVVTDLNSPATFPTDHPLLQASPAMARDDEFAEVIRKADVVLALERVDVAGAIKSAFSNETGEDYLSFGESMPPFRMINVSLEEFALRSWSQDFQELPPADLLIKSRSEPVVSALLGRVEGLLEDDASARLRIEERAGVHQRRREELETSWEETRRKHWDDDPISLIRLVGELRKALGDRAHDAVLAIPPKRWPKGLWDFLRPGAFLGKDGGGGVGSGPGLTVGAALAAKGTGRVVVGIVGDGDLLMAPTALWTAAHHRIPALFVVANNRTYMNDEEHQQQVALHRDRPVENRWVGQRMDDPPVDFASLAGDLGVAGFGPVTDPAELPEVYALALEVVERGLPALVDVRIASG